MANAAAAPHAHHDHAAVRKEYIKVFKWLCALTVIEVAVVYLKHLHVPELIVALLVVIFSSSKAVFVGYYYMHLKSETKWLKMVALLPIIAFAYAFVLGIDLKVYERPLTDYTGAPARTHHGHHHDVKDLPLGNALEQVVEKLPAETTEARSAVGLEAPVSNGAAPSAPATGAPATEAPAASGSDEWK